MDLGFLSHLYAVTGPFATAYLDVSRDTENAQHQIDLRWRAAREDLDRQGAPAHILDAMGEVVGTEPDRGNGQVIVAGQGRVLLDHRLPHAPRRATVSWAPLPHVMPLVAQLGHTLPHIVVVADRGGADISAYGDRGALADERTIEGDRFDIRKVKPGDWAHKNYQQRAENLWETNAKQVADNVNRLARRIGAQLVVAAGDVRAVQFLRDNLHRDVQDVLVTVEESGRGAGASAESLAATVERLVAQSAVREHETVLDSYAEQRGQHARAVEGLAATIEALRRAQVETLLLADDPSSTSTLYVGPEPLHLALTSGELDGISAGPVQECRADAALIRALAMSAAAITVVPPEQATTADGVGALLRYADVSTPA
jgi:hypothetical protein